MMKTRIHTLLPAALLLLTATACEDTLTTPAATIGHGDGPTLTLVLDNNEEKAGTRSTLNDGAPVNHVETVRILVFQGGTETNNYTDATYVGEEVYANEVGAIEWPDEKPDKITYQMNYAFVEGETYTLLGVGMDSHTIQTNDGEIIETFDGENGVYDITPTVGTKLSEAYATLKAGKTKEHIARHDFYTGTTTFTHEGKKTHIDDLLMKRRVAGVMLYVTEIPQKQTEKDGDYRVTSIRVCLGGNANQKSSVRLQRDFENWDKEPDGQDELTGSNVIAEITGLEDWTWTENADFYMEGNNIKTARTGVYMLPLNTTENNTPTFTVKMYGKKLDASSSTPGTTEEGEEKVLSKSFTVEQRDADGTSVTSFPIRSNYLYSIGKYNPDEGIDEPISLSGSPIYLEVLPFDELEVSHDFGEARVQALFDDKENPIYDCINQDITIKILPPLTTIRSRVEKVTLTLGGITYALNEQGDSINIEEDTFEDDNDELTTDEKKELYGNWLYIKKEGDNTPDEQGTYVKTLDVSKDQTTEVTFFITDYARPRRNWGWKVENLTSSEYSWQGTQEDIEHINKDMRTMNVILHTYFNDGTNARTDTLCIRQYNAITVYYNPKDGSNQWTNCGFRREDTKENGNKITAAWKFNNSIDTNYKVYGGRNNAYHGWENLARIGWNYTSDDNWQELWSGSAMQKAQTLFRKISDEKIMTHTNPGNNDWPKSQRNSGECWYLPARYEMEGLITMVSSIRDGHQLDNHETFEKATTETEVQFRYWTSTIYDDGVEVNTNMKAWAFHYLKNDNEEKAEGTREFDRYQTGYIRQARRFPDQLKKGY